MSTYGRMQMELLNMFQHKVEQEEIRFLVIVGVTRKESEEIRLLFEEQEEEDLDHVCHKGENQLPQELVQLEHHFQGGQEEDQFYIIGELEEIGGANGGARRNTWRKY